jgi:endonuclease/exonuclease/phosphatase family metal-dependent hydrolase
MKIKVGTFNLFQYAQPPFSYYTKREKFTIKQWDKKTTWIKKQIRQMDCDLIGFQEVFSKEPLEELVKELGFDYFATVENARLKEEDDKVFVSTTVGLASKFPIKKIQKVEIHKKSLQKHHFEGRFKFSRTPIKAYIELPDKKELLFYVCHLKSNRQNEFEYIFTKKDTLEQKEQKIERALKEGFSASLKQRLCEASSLFFDIKKQKDIPTILVCDLNDKEYSITIEALTNNKFYDKKRKSHILTDACYLHNTKNYNPHPERKEKKRTPTSYFAGKGNVLDFIFVSKEFNTNHPPHLARVSDFTVHDNHLEDNPYGDLLDSDHAQVVCELEFIK